MKGTAKADAKRIEQQHHAEKRPLVGCLFPPKADPKTIEMRRMLNQKILDSIPIKNRYIARPIGRK